MTKKITTVDEHSRHAAERFLQTAVFVDDNIYERRGHVSEPETLQATPSRRKPALKSAGTTPKAVAGAAAPEAPEDYSPQALLTSFAKKKVVCSLYQPTRQSSLGKGSDAYKLCAAADIAIVDWVLYGDDGDKALELITNLVSQSLLEEPEQIRLVLVYTDRENLNNVADRVFECLSEALPGSIEPIARDQGLALHTSNSRIVVLGKPTRLKTRSKEFESYEVEEGQLADRAIEEFAKLADGLLQGAALLGLAELRRNTRRILTQFDSKLDPAYLTHRALSLPHEDSSGHLIALLVAEIQAVLEDQMENHLPEAELLEDWCTSSWQPGEQADTFLSQTAKAQKCRDKPDVREFAKAFVTSGPQLKETFGGLIGNSIAKKEDDKFYWTLSDQGKLEELATFLLPSKESQANALFAQLMSRRTQYEEVDRALKLGTIVKTTDDRFFLCLQPVCDSVRLEAKTKFPFVELYARDPSSGTRFGLVVSEEGKLHLLRAGDRPRDFHLDSFKPNPGTGQVLAERMGPGCFLFRAAESGGDYVWLAQLKEEHAQREAERLARQLSRVGLTESEWLRRMSR